MKQNKIEVGKTYFYVDADNLLPSRKNSSISVLEDEGSHITYRFRIKFGDGQEISAKFEDISESVEVEEPEGIIFDGKAIANRDTQYDRDLLIKFWDFSDREELAYRNEYDEKEQKYVLDEFMKELC